MLHTVQAKWCWI